MKNKFWNSQLENGLEIIGQPFEHEICHIALLINAGTRDEGELPEGTAHFLEHCLFKGTKKRNYIHILSELDSVGGELNAYTTKEEVCIHATCHRDYLKKAFDLIGDIILNSTFPSKEINKEKEIIKEEIRSCKDNPAEQIYDDFESLLFRGNTLQRRILGQVKSVSTIQRADLSAFIHKYFVAHNMVLAISGGPSKKKIFSAAQEAFNKIPSGVRYRRKDQLAIRRSAGYSKRKAATAQAHTIMGAEAFAYADPLRMPLILLNNILGGPAMNTRLNLLIREKLGYAYTIESGFHSYDDTGIFHIYYGTESKNNEKCLDAIRKELTRFAQHGISKEHLEAGKIQLLGQQAVASENRLNVILSTARHLLKTGKLTDHSDTQKVIRKITRKEVQECASIVFQEGNLFTLTYSS